MSQEFKQTWWDKNLPTQFEVFQSWIGDSSSRSKKLLREYVIDIKCKSLVDLGCGTATEFFAYRNEYPELTYLGVDSSEFLYKRNVDLGVPMVMASVESTGLPDSSYEVAFSRHVIEHQPSFEPILNEMIRVGSKKAIHIFFIPPKDNIEVINHDPKENLYHNQFDKLKIEKFIESNSKVKEFSWIGLQTESVLIIDLQ